MKTKKDKLEMIYLYSMLAIVIAVICSFIYLLFDKSLQAQETVIYIIFGGEIGIVIFASLIWKLNRNNGKKQL